MAAQVAHGPATVPVGLETPPTWQSDASEFEQLGPARPVLLEQLAGATRPVEYWDHSIGKYRVTHARFMRWEALTHWYVGHHRERCCRQAAC